MHASLYAKSLQLYPTLCDAVDRSLPGSSVHRIFQQEYWSRLPCPPSENLPNPRIEPMSPALAGGFFITSTTLKAEEPEIKLPTSAGSSKKQASSRKSSISALLTMPKPLTVWIIINWKILKEMGISDHLTCSLRNLYAGQEATVRTGHKTTDWFQIGKAVRQGCILSPCLFNLYAEYIMQNSRLDEAQAGFSNA